ncbi:hypothetical protein KC19_11G010100 [Ceratodon purpureus]|uniref:DNA-directed RNA polymerases I, II, and III subunit RPABC3 n=2 Tax=Ceratodon purpureus TaxID=3225 RepID=A0A8T0GBK0_CERPU|nr:hypothetical protein KC19_11G010100 [Ceratodon purpureus]
MFNTSMLSSALRHSLIQPPMFPILYISGIKGPSGTTQEHTGNAIRPSRESQEIVCQIVCQRKCQSVRTSVCTHSALLRIRRLLRRCPTLLRHAMADTVLFEDIFSITQLDPDGKKFDKVSRIVAHSEQFDMDVLLDVNIDIYPMHVGEKFTLALASTLSLDGTLDDGTFDQSRRKSLADKYEYVMYGKVYKYTDLDTKGPAKVESYVSFGGLLMCLKGDPNNLNNLAMDQRVYLLMRKV